MRFLPLEIEWIRAMKRLVAMKKWAAVVANYEQEASSSVSVADRTVDRISLNLRCFVVSTVVTKKPYSVEF